MKTQVQAHCRVFDALADSQRGGHDVIIRALDIFEAAATAFKSVTSQQASTEDHHNSSVLPTIAQGQLGLSMGSPDAGGGNDEGRRAYLRAEKGLALAREQLVKNAETLALMAQELEGAKRCICKCGLAIVEKPFCRQFVCSRASSSQVKQVHPALRGFAPDFPHQRLTFTYHT